MSVERRCGHCGAGASENARFCRQCGRALGEETEGEARRASAMPEAAPSGGVAPPAVAPRSRFATASTCSKTHRLWLRFRPALWLWVILLATTGLYGIYATATEATSPWLDLIITVFDAIVILLFCHVDFCDLKPWLTRIGITGRTWWIPGTMLVGMAAFMTVYFEVLTWLGVEPVSYLEDYLAHDWPLWSAFVMIAVCPGVFEELAFRGFIMGRLEQVLRPGEALFLQAAMFSILHLSPLIFASHFFMGFLLGVLRRQTRSLYPGMLVHMTWNAFVLAVEWHGRA